MKTLLIGITLATIAVTAPAAYADDVSPVVTVTLTSSHMDESKALGFAERPRLADVYDSFEMPTNTYWPSTRLVSQSKQAEVKQQQQQLVERLQALATFWQQEGDEDLAKTARETAEQVANWSVIGAEAIGQVTIVQRSDTQVGEQRTKPSFYSHQENARLNIEFSPLLPAGNYELLGGVPSPKWHIVGATTQKQLPFQTDTSVRELMKQHRTEKTGMYADTVEVIDLSGNNNTVPVAYYNAKNDSAPLGAVFVVGFSANKLPDDFETVNNELTALARFWKPE